MRDVELKEKFKNSFKSKFNTFARPATVEKPTVSNIVISAYEENAMTETEDLKRFNQELVPRTAHHVKRKSILANSNGREETDIIRGFLEQRIKNESKKKSELIVKKNEAVKRR